MNTRPRRVRRRLLGFLLLGASATLVAGCGFTLRRSTEIGFETLYAGGPIHSPLIAEIRRVVKANTITRIVDNPAVAAARLEILSEIREKEVVGFSSTGRPREYQLRLRIGFRVTGRLDQEIVPSTELLVRRDITTTDIQLLAKEQEEELLYREMQSDIVRQLLRRLAALRP